MNNSVNLRGSLFKMGTKGYSAYEVAVQNGFVGTEEEWLESLRGPKGEDGFVVFEDLTEDQKEMLRGPQGIPGTNGVDGKSATIQVGTVTTLPAGSNATVKNVGTENEAVFNFGIPRGADGSGGSGSGTSGENGATFTPNVSQEGILSWTNDKGLSNPEPVNIKGPEGPAGRDGTNGTNGSDGQAATIGIGTVTIGSTASVTNSGTSTNAIFDFVIPRGTNGTNGVDGKSATIQVGTVTTLPAGSNATVKNVGTENEAVFNFGIPRGADGSGGSGSGTSGENGATFTPNVSQEGILSWTNDKGLSNPEPVNIKGPEGPAGRDGTNGTNGSDGYTPIKGTDYYTESDKQEIVNLVLEALPNSEEVSY